MWRRTAESGNFLLFLAPEQDLQAQGPDDQLEEKCGVAVAADPV